MELKLSWGLILFSLFAFLIEPMWNWNSYKSRGLTIGAYFLIEPMWNWNLSAPDLYGLLCAFLIEPMWNWNINLQIVNVHCVRFLIEPMWNWNQSWKSYSGIRRWIFNWTNVELKQRYLQQRWTYSIFLIEPMWNWNRFGSSILSAVAAFLIEPMWNWNKDATMKLIMNPENWTGS